MVFCCTCICLVWLHSSGEFDDDIEAMTFTKGKVEGLIAHEQYEIENRGGVSFVMC